jgi:hypothetical protein
VEAAAAAVVRAVAEKAPSAKTGVKLGLGGIFLFHNEFSLLLLFKRKDVPIYWWQ